MVGCVGRSFPLLVVPDGVDGIILSRDDDGVSASMDSSKKEVTDSLLPILVSVRTVGS